VAPHDLPRRIALSLPEAREADHHGRPSFRVENRIFATLWDERHVNVMLDEDGIRTHAQAEPGTCSAFRWGKRVAALQVDVERADEKLLRELLTDAWEGKASKRLLGARRAGAG
jgi:hypothetical protein